MNFKLFFRSYINSILYSTYETVATVRSYIYIVYYRVYMKQLLLFGQAKLGQKGLAPQPLLARKAFVPLCIPGFSPFMDHHNISLRFQAGG